MPAAARRECETDRETGRGDGPQLDGWGGKQDGSGGEQGGDNDGDAGAREGRWRRRGKLRGGGGSKVVGRRARGVARRRHGGCTKSAALSPRWPPAGEEGTVPPLSPAAIATACRRPLAAATTTTVDAAAPALVSTSLLAGVAAMASAKDGGWDASDAHRAPLPTGRPSMAVFSRAVLLSSVPDFSAATTLAGAGSRSASSGHPRDPAAESSAAPATSSPPTPACPRPRGEK
uniref:Uncharacterized protein n=1 Tax=Oryza sativa subsp. japonica TaxID=39947 RepID=Q6YWR9_ORYSJ|nr:hypothetical protein [Oryza sativa Japonica Group]